MEIRGMQEKESTIDVWWIEKLVTPHHHLSFT